MESQASWELKGRGKDFCKNSDMLYKNKPSTLPNHPATHTHTKLADLRVEVDSKTCQLSMDIIRKLGFKNLNANLYDKSKALWLARTTCTFNTFFLASRFFCTLLRFSLASSSELLFAASPSELLSAQSRVRPSLSVQSIFSSPSLSAPSSASNKSSSANGCRYF